MLWQLLRNRQHCLSFNRLVPAKLFVAMRVVYLSFTVLILSRAVNANPAGPSDSPTSVLDQSLTGDGDRMNSPADSDAEAEIQLLFRLVGRLFNAELGRILDIPELLDQIVRLCERIEQASGQSVEQPIKRLALSLIDASKISDDKCRQGIVLQYHRWIKEYSDKASLLSYINLYKQVQTMACSGLLNRLSMDVDFVGLPNLNKLLFALDNQDSQRAVELHKHLPVPKLDQFLAEKLFGKAKTASQLNYMVKSMFEEECDQVQSEGNRAIDLHQLIVWLAGTRTKLPLSSRAKRLLANANLCRHLFGSDGAAYSEMRVLELAKTYAAQS